MDTIKIHGVEMPISYTNEDGLELKLVIYPSKQTGRLKVIYAHGKPIDNQILKFSTILEPEESLKKELEACKSALINRGYING